MAENKEAKIIKVIVGLSVVLVIGIVIFVTFGHRQSKSDTHTDTESIKTPKHSILFN